MRLAKPNGSVEDLGAPKMKERMAEGGRKEGGAA